ncbi:MAG: NUDIX hydrolase [Chloroflexi bacterium]|nr:NUDIX hydrolase [Chloroflexota bacterium]
MLRWLLRVWRQLPRPLQQKYLRLRYGHFGVGMAALIRDEHGRILLVHRTYSRDEPWALPGGWPEGVANREDRVLGVARAGDVLDSSVSTGELHKPRQGALRTGDRRSVRRSNRMRRSAAHGQGLVDGVAFHTALPRRSQSPRRPALSAPYLEP